MPLLWQPERAGEGGGTLSPVFGRWSFAKGAGAQELNETNEPQTKVKELPVVTTALWVVTCDVR